jgi:type I restriction-modification system DNA methylase subunit
MTQITEWTLTADVASQINDILRDHLELPFSRALVEVRGRGSRRRRDLTIYGRTGEIVLTGEVKLPNNPDGRSPFQEAFVIDAHQKANQVGAEYFFTWNINRCVLWKTFEQGKPITERYVEHFYALPSPICEADELLHPRVQDQIRHFLGHFLQRCAAIITGAEPMLWLPLDEKFIYIWEAALDPLMTQTLAAIHARYKSDKTFRNGLDKWMRDDQGWTLSKDEEVIRDNLERAAKFSCYVLANKIIFYKALRRRFAKMRALRIPSHIRTGSELKKLLDGYFEHAIAVSRDYETVFRGDFGDTLPFLSNAAVDSWRTLSAQTDAFDFTHINYEIIGQIFERMLSPTERHKYGQHYTRSEVVDLINSFCIREPEVTVLDPACGGGTFLVRAYQRKRDLSGGTLTHHQLLNQLYGVDISAYAVHLTTINLATRDLVERANYPLVVRRDFFQINPGDPVIHIPLGGGEQSTWTETTKVDVIVGNPPYVRQEKINEYYGKSYKKFLQELAQKDTPKAQLSGRSDIHCYFFTHGLTFLKDNGYMGLLTSSNWLDTTYGFRLQEFLLENFEIIAVLESNCEPWFTGARVTTAATILRRQPDADKRATHNVKFVWLKKPLSDFLTYAKSEEDRRLTFEELRRRIESLTADEETDAWRVRVVNQGELYRMGCLPFAISEGEESDNEETEDDQIAGALVEPNQGSLYHSQPVKIGDYFGYKWGIFLRAPEIFFKLLRRCGDRFVPLGQIADVPRGVTSGCDKFFFPRDITDEAVAAEIREREFKQRYGIRRSETDRIRIVRAGDGSVHLIEAEYLEPEVHSLMEIDSVEIDPKNLARKILLVSEPKEKLKNTRVLEYIRWGEREGFHQGATVQGRVGAGRFWYDLTTERRGALFWPKSQQYRHVIPLNSRHLICNCNLYNVYVRDSLDTKLLCAVLNSTIVALSKHQFGRYMGREGNLKTEVVDVKMMLVPDPRGATPGIRRRLEAALDSMRNRKALPLVDVDSDEPGWTGELALPDRQELDDAVFELLGITDPKEREMLRVELYDEMTKLYRQIRATERIMQRYRSMTDRGGRATPHSLAEEIWEDLKEKTEYKTPLDFIPPKARCEELNLPTGRAKLIKQHLFQPDGVQIGETFFELGDPARSHFVKQLAHIGITGKIPVPIDPDICRKALAEYRAYVDRITDEFTRLAAMRTADESMQERVVRELWRKLGSFHR